VSTMTGGERGRNSVNKSQQEFKRGAGKRSGGRRRGVSKKKKMETREISSHTQPGRERERNKEEGHLGKVSEGKKNRVADNYGGAHTGEKDSREENAGSNASNQSRKVPGKKQKKGGEVESGGETDISLPTRKREGKHQNLTESVKEGWARSRAWKARVDEHLRKKTTNGDEKRIGGKRMGK